jgi:hypothetical protein
MVGAGIFALLGEAGAVAGSAVWLSFLVAGVVASLQGYAVAKLGARYPSSGGIVTFLLQGYGGGHITAITSWLLYFAALIVTAMVSVSFGSYGSRVVLRRVGGMGWCSPVVIIGVAAVNIAGPSPSTGCRRDLVICSWSSSLHRGHAGPWMDLLAPSTCPRNGAIMSAALTFFATWVRIGFTGGDLQPPGLRAMYLASASPHLSTDLGVWRGVGGHRQRTRLSRRQPSRRSVKRARDGRGRAPHDLVLGGANIAATRSTKSPGMFPPVFGERASGAKRLHSVSSLLLVTSSTSPPSLPGQRHSLAIFLVVSSRRSAEGGTSMTWVLIAAIVR